MIDLRAIQFIACTFMVLLSVWAGLACVHAAIYWRILGDQREGMCWMLVGICVMSAVLFGYSIDRRRA